MVVHACQSRVLYGLRASSSSVVQTERNADMARRIRRSSGKHGSANQHSLASVCAPPSWLQWFSFMVTRANDTLTVGLSSRGE